MDKTFERLLLLATLLTMGLPAFAADAPAAAASAATPAAAPPPLMSFVRPSSFSDVSLSPDGRHLAALVPVPNKPYENMLAVLEGQTAKGLHVIRSGRSTLIADYFWAGNDRLIASMEIKLGGLYTPQPTGELFATNPDGTNIKALYGYRAGDGSFGSRISGKAQQDYAYATPISSQLIDGNQVLIAVNEYSSSRSGTYTYIKRLDIHSGHAVDAGISPARNAELVADHAGQVRVAVAQNHYPYTLMWTRSGNDAPWALANDPQQSGVTLQPIGFNRDNSKLYVRVSRREGPDAIELMDMASGARQPVFRGQFANPGAMLRTADGLDYYAVIDRDGVPSLHYIAPDSDEAQLTRALGKNFPGQLAYFSSFTHDGKHAVVRVYSDRNPGDFYLFDLVTRNASYLFSAAPWIDPAQMRPMQAVTLQARDGLPLHGFLTLPAGPKPYPLVVLPHGGPHGVADRWGYDPEVQLLATHGYAVLQVNYRGSGGYGAQFQQRGYGQWGLAMQDDLTDATHWAIAQGYASAGRICIYGASYGGYAALEGAVREPDLYKCAIGYAGVYDLRIQLDDSDTQESYAGNSYLDVALGRDREDLLKRSPLAGVARIKADILLIHGKSDPRVPFKNFREFTKALDKAGKPYESLVEAGEGHGFFTPEHRLAAYTRILDFLQRNLGGQPPARGAH